MKTLNLFLTSRNPSLCRVIKYDCNLNLRLLTIILFLLSMPVAFGQNRMRVLDSILTTAYKQGKINGNLLIADKGQIIYCKSFGFANRATKENLNENSVFGLASVSKQFTAMGIVILKEQGKLNFDDKITKYLPELTAYDNISIRNLLNHTSGLVPDLNMLDDTKEVKEYLSTRLVGNTATNKDMVAFLSMYKPKLRFNPNTKWEYCNTGYMLLASIIEKVSGLTYAEYLDKVIFKPLEMNNTFVYSGIIPDRIKNQAYDYIYSDNLKKYLSADSIISKNKVKAVLHGGGTIYSTVIDLLKWDRALYTDKLVSASSLKEIFEPAILSDKTATLYGFGWFIKQDPNYGKRVFHDGATRGYVTFIERNIDHDKTVIMLENYDRGIVPQDIINRNLYNVALPNEVKLSEQQLKEFSGTYVAQNGFELKIWSEKGQIYGQGKGQRALPLFAENELMLFAKEVDLKLQFEKNNQGKIACLYILQNGKKAKAEKK